MKDKYIKLRDAAKTTIDKRKSCKHEWDTPIYEPNLFDGDGYYCTKCKKCGETLRTPQPVDIKSLKNKH